MLRNWTDGVLLYFEGKANRSDERLNVKCERKVGSRDVSRVWDLNDSYDGHPEITNKKRRIFLQKVSDT